MAAKVLRYYDSDPMATISCTACGWSERGADYQDLSSELLDFRRPQCDRMLLVVALPTIEATRRAASEDDPRAIADLSASDAQEARWRQAKQLALREPSQLPDLPESEIRFE
jgi:hypothetical protein